MKEEHIRPAQLVKKMQSSTSHDVNFLLKRKKEFVKTACPSCAKKNYKKFFKKRGFSYSICKNCRTYFLNPRPNLDLLGQFYKQSKVYEYFNKYIFPQTEKARSKNIFVPRVSQIIKICKYRKIKKPCMMDVGAGFGSFLKVAKNSNFFSKLVAIEPSRDGAKNCKKNKLDVFEDILENANTKIIKKQDIITSFEVIEHLYSPFKFLKLIKKFLKKNGLFIITCPNGEGFDIQLLKEKSNSIDHEHINYFNPNSIKKLYDRAGFKIIEIFTPGKLDVDIVINNLQKNKKQIYKNENFITKFILDNKNLIIKKKFQEFLMENNLSSNMWVVAKIKN